MSTVWEEISKAATAVRETVSAATSLLRFMSLSFRDLSFGMGTVEGAPDGHSTDFIEGATRCVKHCWLGKKRSQGFCLDRRGGSIPEWPER